MSLWPAKDSSWLAGAEGATDTPVEGSRLSLLLLAELSVIFRIRFANKAY